MFMNDLPLLPNGTRSLPVSGKIRARIERAHQRYHVNHNIAAFVEQGDRDEVERERKGVLEYLFIDIVRSQLRNWFGDAMDGWRPVKTFHIAAALLLQTRPVGDSGFHKTRRSDWPHACGEYSNASTFNWALYSGRCAAETIVATDAQRRASA